jgi:hypothetical protein
MSRLLVHVGPTLPEARVHQIAPQAEILPPAEGGMLGLARPAPGDVVVIIDGYYRDRPAVRHKEIMHLIHLGVHVVGAGSMGALRAAELDGHGMTGVGRIYQMYKDGEIDGDDEVAIRHRTAEFGYRADSIALVNLRFGCRRAVDEGVISAAGAAAVLAAAKELVFDERTWPRISAGAQQRLSPESALAEVGALERFFADGACDLKAQDAVAAIRYGHGLLDAPASVPLADPLPAPQLASGSSAPDGAPWPLWRTCFLRDWVSYWDSYEETEVGDRISDADILTAARLYSPDYPDIHQEALTEILVRAAARQPGELTAERYVMGLLGLRDGDPVPAQSHGRLSEAERQLPTASQALLVAVRTWPTSICQDWGPDVVARLKSDPSWGRWRELVLEANAVRASRARVIQDPIAGLLFLRRWGVSGPAATREMGRRGFLTLTGLGQLASRFAPQELVRQRQAAAARG